MMFNEAEIPCRIIIGTANGGNHAWNIVKVDEKWYNIDLTCDDPISPDGKPVLTYNYFLKNDTDFKNHIRDTDFKTKSFLKTYPIAKISLR